MKVSLNFIYLTVSVSGISLGYFFCFLFFNLKTGIKKANIILSLLFFILSTSLLSTVLIFTNLFLYFPHLIRLEWILFYLIPILLYFYVKALTQDDYKIKIKELLFFIPFIFCIFYLLPFFIKSGLDKISYIKNILEGRMYISDMINRGVLNIVQVFYIILIFIILTKHRNKIKNSFSTIENIDLSWIFYFNIIYIFAVVIGLILDILIVFFNFEYLLFYKVLSGSVAVLIPLLGYKGLKQKKIFYTINTRSKFNNNNNNLNEDSKYHYEKLKELLENEKLYINHDLTLAYFSSKLSISKEYIIQLIWKYKKRNFYDFINSYRVEELKKYLIDKQVSFDQAALKSGFKSKYVMSKVFKNHTHLTPNEYRHNHQEFETENSVSNIGLFVVNFYNNYELGIYLGIKKILFEKSINLFCFIGGAINSPYFNNIQLNEIYKLANSYNLDGLIALSGTIGSYISKKQLLDFYNKISKLPIVSIGMKIENNPSVTVDNKKGMSELLNHLINMHNYKKIAFIKGINNNMDAEERYSTYKNVLRQNNIQLNQKLIVQGNFLVDFGKEAVGILLDERCEKPDVIVCANDDMAIGVIEELQKRNINVPEDIAVTGFDDIPDSKKLSKSLTTVKQPLFESGIQASLLMLSILQGKIIKENIELLSKIKLRQTCGCNTDPADRIVKIEKNIFYNKPEVDKIKKRIIKKDLPQIVNKISGEIFKIKLNKWLDLLINTFFDDLIYMRNNNFLIVLEKIINDSLLSGFDISSWYIVISEMLNKICSYDKLNINSNIINLIQININEIINDCIMESQLFPVHKNNERKQQWLLSSQKLIFDYTMTHLKNTLISELPKLGISSCYIVLYDNDDNNIYSRIVFAYKDYEEKQIPNNKLQKNEIIPGIFVGKGNTYIIRSLYFINEQLGYLVVENDFADITIYEILASYLSKVLKKIKINYSKNDNSNEAVIIPGVTDSSKKYEKLGLSKETAEKYFKKLIYIIEKEKIYMNPDLKINLLAKRMDISKHNLSFIINKYVGLNFYDFINEYRVSEVIKKLSNINKKQISILDVAEESGFKSKSTFNKFFKKYTNLTPSEYIKTKL